MKNTTQIAALGLVSLLNLVPASHAMTTDNHGQMDNQITVEDWAHLDGTPGLTGATAYDAAFNPFSNYGCANIGGLDQV